MLYCATKITFLRSQFHDRRWPGYTYWIKCSKFSPELLTHKPNRSGIKIDLFMYFIIFSTYRCTGKHYVSSVVVHELYRSRLVNGFTISPQEITLTKLVTYIHGKRNITESSKLVWEHPMLTAGFQPINQLPAKLSSIKVQTFNLLSFSYV